MKIKCDRQILSEAVAGVSKAVTQRSTVPALEGILFKAEGFNLSLTGYDFELAIITNIEANVIMPGEIVIPAKLFNEMVRKITADEISIEVDEKNNILVSGAKIQYTIMGISPQEYPPLPNPDVESTLEISPELLTEMVEATIYAVATDEKRPAHMGERFEITDGNLKAIALDGFRLAITERKIDTKKEINIVIPQKTMSEVIKLIADRQENVNIFANKRFVMFSNDKYTIISRLLEGEFLDYHKVLTPDYTTKAVVETKPFIDAIERASLIITEKLKNPLLMEFVDNNITISCKTNLGSVVDELAADIEGESVHIGFNNRYLLDALRNARCEKVVFEINGPLSPVKIKPYNAENFLYLVLPVRFKS